MAYDFHGSWGSTADHHSRLTENGESGAHHKICIKAQTSFPPRNPPGDRLSAEHAVETLLKMGAAAAKIVVGIPTYGRSFTVPAGLVATTIHQYFTPMKPLKNVSKLFQNGRPPIAASGAGRAGPITKAAGSLGYNEICQKVNTEGWTEVNEIRRGPYAYKVGRLHLFRFRIFCVFRLPFLGGIGVPARPAPPSQFCIHWKRHFLSPQGDQWVGYDTPESARVKAEFIIEKGLGGAMIWDLSTDDFRGSCGRGAYPILSSIHNTLNQNKVCEP